ncbi:auxin-responsive protein IAA8-like [Vicia villosa]|uniref:auxin-responsive protein IAA8-like n=1 Tax=Vicia villosa TaxID=3911 RepID=UPI00273BB790|nr:auxin-responsive protein IAA8-like [Vicia villosa]
MSTPLQHDDETSSLNFKETELRLGLPGSQSPQRKPVGGVSLNFNNNISVCSSLNNLVSSVGAKRGFFDAIDESSPKNIKEVLHQPIHEKNKHVSGTNEHANVLASKTQVVGWPPIRSFRKNSMASNLTKNNDEDEGKPGSDCLYVKVSMDGAPYLRKIDIKIYNNYKDLSSALEKMFTCFTIGQCNSPGLPGKDGLSESSLRDLLDGSEYVLTYEDKDGDWMLVGDVPWRMFADSCRRLRIMKGSEAIGLAPRAMEKSRSQK